MKYKKIALFVVVLAVSIFLRAPKAHAATINVTANAVDTNNASGNCSLYEAVESAETDMAVDNCTSGSGSDTINIPDGTYTLTQNIDISTTITLDGTSRLGTIVDGDGLYGISATNGGTNPTLTIKDITMQNGIKGLTAVNQDMSFVIDNTAWHDFSNANVGEPAGIQVSANTDGSEFGSFTFTNSVVYNNSGDKGAGVEAQLFVTATITACEFYDNTTTGVDPYPALNIRALTASVSDTDVHDNDEFGATVVGHDITIDHLDVTDNSQGGLGINPILNPPASMSLKNSSVTGNAGQMGLYISSDTGGYEVDISNVTVSDNSGLLYPAMTLFSDENDPISGTIANVTIADNVRNGDVGFTAPGAMMFMSQSQIDPTVTLQNMLISNNLSGGNQQNCAPIPVPVMFWPDSLGNNLSDDDTCSAVFDQPGTDLNDVSAGLDPLTEVNNTWVHPIQASSPANDGGATVLGISTDQRGTARPQNGAFDIGAYETTEAPTGGQQGGGSGNGGSGGGNNAANTTTQNTKGTLGETGQTIKPALALVLAAASLTAIGMMALRTRYRRYSIR